MATLLVSVPLPQEGVDTVTRSATVPDAPAVKCISADEAPEVMLPFPLVISHEYDAPVTTATDAMFSVDDGQTWPGVMMTGVGGTQSSHPVKEMLAGRGIPESAVYVSVTFTPPFCPCTTSDNMPVAWYLSEVAYPDMEASRPSL